MEITRAGKLRCRIFLPDRSEVTFAKRGFSAPDATRRANLEKVGIKFLQGFSYGMGGRSLPEIESSLETVESAFRRHWVRDLLASRGAAHVYMAYVGVGWAMARLPRVRWRAIRPSDPLLRWLALGGYGFHQAYFRTRRYVADMVGLAGPYRSHAVQGAAFAAGARVLAGLVTPGTALGVTDGPVPAYELWRERIRKRFE